MSNGNQFVLFNQVYDNRVSTNLDEQAQLEVREDKIKELRVQLETFKESENRQNAVVNSLRQKIAEYEVQAGSIEGAATRSEVAIASLQAECSSYQNRILDLETRLKSVTHSCQINHISMICVVF